MSLFQPRLIFLYPFLDAVFILSSWCICCYPCLPPVFMSLQYNVSYIFLWSKLFYDVLSFFSDFIGQIYNEPYSLALGLYRILCFIISIYQIRKYLSSNCPVYVIRFNAVGFWIEYVKGASWAAYSIMKGTLQVYKWLKTKSSKIRQFFKNFLLQWHWFIKSNKFQCTINQ